MADIKLKNQDGTPITFTGVSEIKVPSADGTTIEEFIQPEGNKNITAATTVQTNIDVTDFATVSIDPTPTETKTATPTTSSQTITPATGKFLESVVVNAIQTETKTATANGTVTPTSGKYLSSVTVAIPVYNGEVQ